MSARKIDGWWYADFRVLGERYRKRSPANTRAEAQRFEQELRKELALRGTLRRDDTIAPVEVAEAPLFGEFAERWMRDYVVANNRPSEQRAKRFALDLHLLPAFGRSRINTITTQQIEQLKGKLVEKKLSAKSINNYLTILGKCLSTAVEWEELSVMPRIRHLKCAPPPFRFLLDDEVRAILSASRSESMLHALVLTAARTGLRSCELLALQWGDVDLRTRQLCVRRAVVRGHVGSTKSYQVRYVPLTHEVTDELARLPRIGPLVFHRDGQLIQYEYAAEHLRAACRLAGISPCGWHVLRHTFASHLAQRGAPLHFIQKLLGHSSIKMTERYAHLQAANLFDTIALLDGPSKMWAASGQRGQEASRPPEGEAVFRLDSSAQSSKKRHTVVTSVDGAPGWDRTNQELD